MKKIIFVAGPVRGNGSIEAKKKNIEIARKHIKTLIENNIPYYSPHLNVDQETIYMNETAGKFAKDLNAEMLGRCDALAVLPGWENSSGTRGEIENAQKRSLPIFYLSEENAIGKIKNWLQD